MATGTAIAEEVAANLEEVAEVTRTVNAAVVGAFMGGTWFGMAVGGVLGYRLGVRRTKAKAMEEAEAEIDEMRESFRQREVARQNEYEKRIRGDDELDPEAVREAQEEILIDYTQPGGRPFVMTEEPGRPLPASVPVRPPKPVVPGDLSAPVSPEAVNLTDHRWNYADEFANRRPGKPYVIHEDEFTNDNLPSHSVTTYTYYQRDGVLADEDGSRLPNADELIGNALSRFGHGTGDPNIVFVRNDKLLLQIEVTRLPNESYEESVEGLQNDKT